MDNYEIVEVKIIQCLWSDVYSTYGEFSSQSIGDVFVWCTALNCSSAPHTQHHLHTASKLTI